MIRAFTAVILLSLAISCNAQTEVINLAGKWNLCLDSVHHPVNVDPKALDFIQAIALPSTLDSAGIGNPVHVQPLLVREVMLHLQRKVSYIGPAYYQKEVSIPKNWNGEHISLKLERVLWESTLWIDGKKIGLSIKQALPPKVVPPAPSQPRFNRSEPRRDNRGFSGQKKPEAPVTLDDKISRFLKESDERMQPLKNKVEPRRRKNNQG
ncbi:MAG TPA: hypothetical protein PKW50_06600 [Syntrophomonas sp.]|nr:hypothetical protein [Syntrophomonas sp.]